jgi:hypothetical protein
LSGSPSPPPFCGIPEAAGAGVDCEDDVGVAVEDEDVVGVAELEELEDPELPQPAATSATSTTLSAASRGRALVVAFSNIVIGIGGSFRCCRCSGRHVVLRDVRGAWRGHITQDPAGTECFPLTARRL